MKNTDKKFLTCGLSVVAAMMASMLFPAVSSAQTPAVPASDTVSAIGDPLAPEPAVTDDTIVEDAPIADLTVPPATAPAAPVNADADFPPPPAAKAAADDGLSDIRPIPPQDGLAPAVDPRTQTTTGIANSANVMGDTGVKETHSGQYYDSKSLVPSRELSATGMTGPRKVDPAVEPGSKFVIVEKSASAMSREAQYVAAGRALKLGRYAAAMEMFQNLYDRSPRDPRILMGLAVAQQGAGFSESAAKTYEELLDVQPNSADAIINLMGIMKGQYPSVTLQRLLELREKYPTNPGVPAQIGLVNAELKNYDDAIRYLEIAATMQPQNPAYIYNMAIITDRQGQSKKAIELYERALQLDASNADTVQGLPRDQIYDRLVVLRRKV